MNKIMRLCAIGTVLVAGTGTKAVYADTVSGCQALANTTWTTSVRLSPDFDTSKPLLNDLVTIRIDNVVQSADSFYGLRGTMSSVGSDNFSLVPFYGAQCDQAADGSITWVNVYASVGDAIFRILSRNISHSLSPSSLNIPRHAVSWTREGVPYSNKNEASLNKS